MKQLILFLLALATVLPSLAHAQSGASIKIVKPGDRRNVALGEITVTVEIAGAALSDGYAWQMLIDAVPQGMVRDAMTTNIVMPKPTGPHRLKAQLYDPRGNVIAAHEILVIVAPVENRETIINRAWFSPFMFGLTLVIFGIILIALRLRPRVV